MLDEIVMTPAQRGVRELRRAAAVSSNGHAVLMAREAAEVIDVFVELDRALNSPDFTADQACAAARSILRTAMMEVAHVA